MDTIDEIIVLPRKVESQVKEEEEVVLMKVHKRKYLRLGDPRTGDRRPSRAEREAQEHRRRVGEILRDSLRESERVGRELLAPYDKG
jgi:hypothetical protein